MEHERNGHLENFRRPQAIENSRQYLLLRTYILQKTVAWCPWNLLVITRFRYVEIFFHTVLRFFPACICNHSCYTIYVRFLPRILAFFPTLWGFNSQAYDHFLTNAHIYAHKKAHMYALQTRICIWGHRKSSYYTVIKKLLHVRWRAANGRVIWAFLSAYICAFVRKCSYTWEVKLHKGGKNASIRGKKRTYIV